MTTRRWTLLVGILAAYFGLSGVMSHTLSIVGTLSVDRDVQTETGNPNRGNAPGSASQANADNEQASPHHSAAGPAITHDAIALAVSIGYLTGGVALLMNPRFYRILLWALMASLLWAAITVTLVSRGQGDVMLSALPAFVPSLMIDALLLGALMWAIRNGSADGPSPTAQHVPASEQISTPTSFIEKTPVITGWGAGLCAVILPFWLMGVPGVNNAYAKGWAMGLDVVMYYPMAWIIIVGAARLLRPLLPQEHHATLSTITAIVLSACAGVASVRFAQAVRLIAA